MRRTVALVIVLCALVLAQAAWFARLPLFGRQDSNSLPRALAVSGSWSAHDYDLLYTAAFSSARQPNGPLVVYRAPGSDLRNAVPVVTVARGPQVMTPVFFPSPDGRYLALLSPLREGYDTNLNGSALRLLSTDGQQNTLLVPGGVASADQIVWSPDSQSLYYHTGTESFSAGQLITKDRAPVASIVPSGGYDEIERVDLHGRVVTIYQQPRSNGSLRLVGVDRYGNLIMTLARSRQPLLLLRVSANGGASVVTTLPGDILPGNVLGIGSDGESVICERVLGSAVSGVPAITYASISFSGGMVRSVSTPFDTSRYGSALAALNRSSDGRVLVMAQTLAVRGDLAAQGIPGVPAQEALLLADSGTGATQRLVLPPGGQIVQTFWSVTVPASHLHVVSQSLLSSLLASQQVPNFTGSNASVTQQDEWMLEGHAGLLGDAPTPSKMCYGTCPGGDTGAPHVSAAILHGVAYVESDWHQFNDPPSYDVDGEPAGSPVESFDGGWGEYQQTWGMPPQCQQINNCRPDVARIQDDQSYNIGTGVASLIAAWNDTAGVVSSSDPNDPYKANDWFFAVWAYNGSYGNDPDDVPSSVYGHWYPGAPFRSIYEEYAWYFAAHNQSQSNGWTDNYLPSLGSSLLPPQSDFANTDDSFVYCVTCTIPDWTSGTYDRQWVGMGAPNSTIAASFTSVFNQNGGENVVGLPRDNGGGAAVHNWGAGLIQDFGGGSALPGAIMLANGATTPYWVYGPVWTQYLTVDHGVAGCHGYPTSPLQPYVNTSLGTDSYERQNFQRGYILWDATKHAIVSDLCRSQFVYPLGVTTAG